MSIAALIRRMAEAGATPEAIAIAVEAIEERRLSASSETPHVASRHYERERKRAQRSRLIVFRRDDYLCAYCGEKTDEPQCDHVVPLSRGGLSTLDNLVTACRPCNSSKRAKTVDEWKGAAPR